MTRKIIDINDVFEQAAQNHLTADDLRKISIDTRCKIITRLTGAIGKNPEMNIMGIATHGLRRLGKSFEVSASYRAWEDKKQDAFIDNLAQRENRSIISALKSWEKTPSRIRQEVLVDTTKLHLSTYMNGVSDVLPVSYSFRELRPKHFKGLGRTVLFGTFYGDLDRRRGRITQNLSSHAFFDDAELALDTAHHETTHAIHFSLAVAYSRGIIRADHPLHNEAQYFHAIERHCADIPTRFFDAYQAQTHETLAEAQGNEISSNIISLTQHL